MPFEVKASKEGLRRLASSLGLALCVLSPLFFLRSLEDAFVLPQRLVALAGLTLAFLSLGPLALGRSPLLWGGLLFFSWNFFCQAFSPLGGPMGPYALAQAVPLGIFLLAAMAGREAQWRAWAWRWSGIAAAGVALYAAIQWLGWDPGDQGAVDFGFAHRAHGSLGNPDFLAGYLVLALPAFLVTLNAAKDSVRRRVLFGASLLLVAVLIWSQVRAAWLAAAFGCAAALWAVRRALRWRALLVLVLLAAAIFAVSSWRQPAALSPAGRLVAGLQGDGSWAGRRFMSGVGWQIFKDHPLMGVGGGNFQQAYLEEQGRQLQSAVNLKEPYRFTADIHQDWIQTAASSGLIGLGLLLWLVLSAGRLALRLSDRALGASLLGLLMAFSVQALFHFPLGIQASALLFWGGLGFLSAVEEPVAEGKAWPWPLLALPLALAVGLTGRQMMASAALNSGTWLLEHGRPQEAAEFLGRASKLWPDDARAWLRLGRAQDALGRTDDAIHSFDQARQASLGLPEAWANLSLELGKAGQWPAAQAAAEQSLALNPHAAESWSNMGKIRYLQGDVQGAMADLQAGLQQAGPNAVLYFNLGALQMNAGDKEAALQNFEACLKLDPGNREAQRLAKELARTVGHAR